MVRGPQVLLLDDALASVDMKTSAEIIQELREARTKRTCIIVSQRMAAVQDADQIVVLDHGRIIEQGSHDQLLEKNGLYAEMYYREIEQAQEEIAGEESQSAGSERIGQDGETGRETNRETDSKRDERSGVLSHD